MNTALRAGMAIEEAIGRARPFQDDVGSLLLHGSKEAAVGPSCFAIAHTHINTDPGFAQAGDAATAHLRKGVHVRHHHMLNAALDQ